jgi:hypothetical protein
LVEVLLLHRHYRRADVLAGLRAAATAGATRADVVAVETRRLIDDHDQGDYHDDVVGEVCDRVRPVKEPPAAARVVSLTQRRLADPAAVIAGLPPDRRPLPSVAAYDQLLTRRAAGAEPGGAQ